MGELRGGRVSAVSGDRAGGDDIEQEVGWQVARRWQQVDPLLPMPGPMRPGCGAGFAVRGPDGRPVAVATCEHWSAASGSMQVSWGAARRFLLDVRVAGQDIAVGLDDLLNQWRGHLAAVPGTAEPDTAAVVTWPSRDIGGVRTLVRHGLTPLDVIAVRPAGRAAAVDAAARPGVRIRRAGPEDIATVVRLGVEIVRFDTHFGGVTERPDTPAAMEREVARLLAAPEPWTWLAERDGIPVGLLCAQRPGEAAWIAPMVRAEPIAYLMLMMVVPGVRGSGLGAEMAARAHREFDAAGVAVTLLHYEQTNPLSVPFWSRQGYRPLWTSWEARPAAAIR
jgi:GNAT superfamily N-acetyltransferase